MKKLVLVLTVVLSVVAGMRASAQTKNRFGDGPDSVYCKTYLDYYQQYYKQKNYDAALPNWHKALKYCPPTASQNMVGAHGSTLITRQISKNARNKAKVNELVDTLLMLQDIKVQYFPKLKVSSLNSKGTYLLKYRSDNKEKLFEELETIVEELKQNAKPNLLQGYVDTAIELFQNGEKNAEDVINVYESAMEYIDLIPVKDSTAQAALDQIRGYIDNRFSTSEVASCEDLIRIYTPKFNEDPGDVALAGKIFKLLNRVEGCSSNDLYLRAVTSLHRDNPTSKTAYGLYQLNIASGNGSVANGYLEEATRLAEAEGDNASAARFYYELAVTGLRSGNRSKAYSAASKAASLGYGYTGKAYLIIGDIWKATSCGGNEITAYGHFWAAMDYYQMARNADPSLAGEVSSHMSGIGYPAAADAFMYGISNGQSITVSCGGMTKTTTVRLR